MVDGAGVVEAAGGATFSSLLLQPARAASAAVKANTAKVLRWVVIIPLSFLAFWYSESRNAGTLLPRPDQAQIPP
ncbi:hypothetical protein [Achromobacter ruhlandii]|uniref:hypothetical protein n=1 Tax=Achromobacter ruhlandii TaxID=72557 RepID=UPI0020163252|nr:hypothetical protein [Achromobacter ruhlandii]